MPSRLRWFFLGIVTAFAGLGGGAYLFVRAGGVPMETSAKPLPLEQTLAQLALRASIGNAGEETSPRPDNAATMLTALDKYPAPGAACPGLRARPRTTFSRGPFPLPP